MECKNCKHKNPANSSFCEECGTKLEVAQVVNTTVLKEKKPKQPNQLLEKFKKSSIVVKVGVLVAVILIGVSIYLVNAQKLENVAQKCIKGVLTGEADIEACFDIEYVKTPYSSKEDYNNIIEEFKEEMQEGNEDVPDFSVEILSIEQIENSAIVEVELSAVIDGEIKTEKETITFVKTDSFLFFETWKIASEDAFSVYLKEVEFELPTGSKFYINDVLVDTDLMVEENGYDLYTIPTLLDTAHNLKVEVDGITIIDYEEEYFYYSTDLTEVDIDTFNTEELEKMEEEALAIINTLYDQLIAKTSFDDVLDTYAFEGLDTENLREEYDEMIEDLGYYSTYTLTDIDFTAIEITDLEVISDGYFITMTLTDTHKVTSSSGVEYTKENDKSYYEEMTIKKIDGTYKLVAIEDLNTYFSR